MNIKFSNITNLETQPILVALHSGWMIDRLKTKKLERQLAKYSSDFCIARLIPIAEVI